MITKKGFAELQELSEALSHPDMKIVDDPDYLRVVSGVDGLRSILERSEDMKTNLTDEYITGYTEVVYMAMLAALSELATKALGKVFSIRIVNKKEEEDDHPKSG